MATEKVRAVSNPKKPKPRIPTKKELEADVSIPNATPEELLCYVLNPPKRS